MSKTLSIKRGDTFDLVNTTPLSMEGPSGTVIDFTGWTAAAQLRERGELVADLTFSWLDATEGLFRLHSAESTSAWPLGELLCDIEFTAPDGTVVSTETFQVRVQAGVTQ
jgi:hypothetical protein